MSLIPSIASADITINAAQSNSNNGVTSRIEINGTLDTSTLVLKDIVPLTNTLRGSGIGVGLYPNSTVNLGGIYSSSDSEMTASYIGINDPNPGLLTSSTLSVGASYTSVIGNNSGFGIDNRYIYLSSRYLSGSPISLTLNFVGNSLADLGFSPGSRSWTLPNQQQVTLNVSGLRLSPLVAISPAVPLNVASGQTVQLAVTGGYSGGPVSYTATAVPSGSGGLTCALSGNLLTISGGPGKCHILATQAANASETGSSITFDIATSLAPAPTPAPIPTLSEWSQIVMVGLMLLSFGLYSRRSQRG